MSTELTPGKKLTELRVIDLKQELDKRGLEKTGVKASLLDRLKKALENEGQDPEQYVFDLIGSKKSKADDSLLEELEDSADDKKSEDVLEDLDLDGVDCEIEDDGIDIGDFVDTDIESTKQEHEQVKNEAKSESAPEEQKPEITAMETDAVKTDTKSEAPVITVEDTDSNDTGPEIIKTDEIGMNKQEANKENMLDSFDLAPPTPTSMPVIAPFTSDDTIKMDTSADRKEDDISLIVHVDESQNEFDMPETPSRASDSGSTRGSVVDLDRGQIEEKAAADAEKAFTNGETTGEDSTKSESKPAPEGTESCEGDKKDGAEKMDTETTQDKPQNETTTTTAANDGKETSAAGSDPKAATKKPDAKSKGSVNSRNLWISGLSTSTRATDLKALFSKYGKVAGAKVVTNARSPGSRCYGFVSMNTAEEASKCIQYLHRTELHGRMISVERAKTDPSQAKAMSAPKKVAVKPTESKEEEQKKESEKKDAEKEVEKKEGEKDKKEVEKKEGDKKDEKKTPETRRHSSGDRRHGHGGNRSYRRRSRSPVRSRGHSRHHSSKDGTTSKDKDAKKEEPKKKEEGQDKAKEGETEKKEGEGKPDEKKTEEKSGEKKGEEKKEEKKKSKEKEMLSLEKIKEERERERVRQRERRLREEERRRRELADRERVRERNRQREIMARQREESVRLQREREYLKIERERLEREKLEAEREKLRLERERRERERQELAEQRRIEALRYEERQRAMKRPYDNRGGDDYWGEPKRATYEQRDARYSDFDARQASSGDQRDRGYQQDRQADRYDRNAARPAERDQRGYDRRDDQQQRGGQTRGGAADRRDVGRRDQPQTRDRDDRNRPEDRYNKYESERDTRRDVPVRDHDRRDQRRGSSPHRAAPSPSNRRNDAGSSGYRAATDDRQSRDRGHDNRAASDRSYSGHGATQRGTEPNAWPNNTVGGPRDVKDARSYPRGGGVSSNGPAASGIIGTAAGTWAAPDRRPTGHVVVPQAADPRGWQAVTSVPQRTVVNAPMLQPAPTTNAFLASAANIMMGVGLARSGDNRYDAYKALPANIRRY